MEFLKFQHPFNLQLAGPSGAGKTELSFAILENFRSTTTIDTDILSVRWCYGVWQERYAIKVPGCRIRYIEGLHVTMPELAEDKPHVIVVDDLMEEVSRDKNMVALFTKISHHRNISVIMLTQNLFFQTKEMRTLSLNAHYIMLMKNPRDKLQIACLGKQVFPNDMKFFMSSYEHAVSTPFSHIILDLTPRCPDDLRLRQWIKDARGFHVYSKKELTVKKIQNVDQ